MQQSTCVKAKELRFEHLDKSIVFLGNSYRILSIEFVSPELVHLLVVRNNEYRHFCYNVENIIEFVEQPE